MPLIHSCKFFEAFFSLLLLFSSFLSFSLPSWLFHRPCSTMASPLSSTVASPHGPVCIISSAGFPQASSPCASTDRCRGFRTYGRRRHPASAAIRAQTTPSAGVGQGGKDAPIWRQLRRYPVLGKKYDYFRLKSLRQPSDFATKPNVALRICLNDT